MAVQSSWRRQRMVLTFLAVFVFFSLAFMSACGNLSAPPGQNPATTDPAAVKKLYMAKCAICHGEDGKLGYNNSKDLSVTTMNRDEIIAIIKTGRTTMPAHQNILSQQQIDALADYTLNLKAKPLPQDD